VTPETLDFLEAGIEAALGESLTETQLVLLRTVMEYLRTVILHVPFTATLAATPHWTTFYDMESWRHDGYAKRLETYRYQEPQTFATIVEPKRKALIESRITTFGEHPSGLGKFTRTMFAQDLRRTLIGAMLGAEAAHGV
jgi:hypothetical protein